MAVRPNSGTSIAELAPVIYALLFLLMFPLLNFATIGLRYAFVMIAAADAANEAAIATTFESGNGPNEPSAQVAATNIASRIITSFQGVKLNATNTRIVITNISTRKVTVSDKKLAVPANTDVNLYMLEPVLDASIDPLVKFPPSSAFYVPAITAPFPVRVSMRKVAENPQGLNL